MANVMVDVDNVTDPDARQGVQYHTAIVLCLLFTRVDGGDYGSMCHRHRARQTDD